MPTGRSPFLFILLLTLAGPVVAQTYETTYTAQTSNNTSTSSSFAANGPNNENASPGNVSKVPMKELAPWLNGPFIIHMQAWWGKSGHPCTVGASDPKCKHTYSVGYRSNDPTQVAAQFSDMVSRGFNGMSLSWSGAGDFTDTSFAAWNSQANSSWTTSAFTVALRVQEDAMNDGSYKASPSPSPAIPSGDKFDYLMCHLSYASKYLSSQAYEKRTFGGTANRPVIYFFFTTSDYAAVDAGSTAPNNYGCGAGATVHENGWQQLRDMIKSKGFADPIFITKDKYGYGYINPSGGEQMAQFTGGMSWGVASGCKSTTSCVDGDDGYYNDFYHIFGSSSTYYSDHLMIADVNKGMDDSLATWTLNRIVNQHAGQLWLRRWNLIGSYFDPGRVASPVPINGVAAITWDDFEEGTGIEVGIDNHLTAITTSLAGSVLSWQVTWDPNATSGYTATDMEKTIHHYELYYSDPSDPQAESLHQFATVQNPFPFASSYTPAPPSLDISSYGVPNGAQLFVKAVGQPSIFNHMNAKSDAKQYLISSPQGILSGVVKKLSDGTPIANATVQVVNGPSAFTGADGTYSFSLPPGTYSLTGSAQFYLSREYDNITVANGAATPQDIQLSTSGRITGNVTLNGAAFSGATIGVTGGNIPTNKNYTSDASGNYTTDFIPVGGYTVSCSAPNASTVSGTVTVTSGSLVTFDCPLTTNYTYITGLELPATNWSMLDDCGGTATCSTVTATSTVHTAPNAVEFSLGGNNPPGSQIGRWLTTVATDTGSAANFEVDEWIYSSQIQYSAGLMFELSHVYNGYWYHFLVKCDFVNPWMVWDETNNAWVTTTASCSRPPTGTWMNYTFHFQRAAGNIVHFSDVTVQGTQAVLNVNTAAPTTSWPNFNKIGIKLMGNTSMNDYSAYLDDLRLGYK